MTHAFLQRPWEDSDDTPVPQDDEMPDGVERETKRKDDPKIEET